MVCGVHCDELLDIVGEKLFEFEARLSDAVAKVLGRLPEHAQCVVEGFGLETGVFVAGEGVDHAYQGLGLLREHAAKFVARPLHAVQRLLGEHLERA